MRTASICVFCGARSGHKPAYAEAAIATGKAIATQGWRLVYGAGDVGIVGEVARSAQTAGAETLGIIPAHLMGLEKGKRDLTAFVVTETMHERKKVMFTNSDAIAVLPGGAGSLDEFFEVLTWAQIGLHRKPIVLLNLQGSWTPLLTLIDHIIAEGFADASIKGLFRVAEDVPGLIATLQAALPKP